MLDSFLKVAYAKSEEAAAQERLVEKMTHLPEDFLHKLASGEEKLAFGFHDDCWIEKFKGTPLFDQALELEKQDLQERMSDNSHHTSTSSARDELGIQRKMLDLELLEAEGGGGGEEPAPEEEGLPPEAAAEEAPPEEEPPAEEAPPEEAPPEEAPPEAAAAPAPPAAPAPEKPAPKVDVKVASARMRMTMDKLAKHEPGHEEKGKRRKGAAKAGLIGGAVAGGLGLSEAMKVTPESAAKNTATYKASVDAAEELYPGAGKHMPSMDFSRKGALRSAGAVGGSMAGATGVGALAGSGAKSTGGGVLRGAGAGSLAGAGLSALLHKGNKATRLAHAFGGGVAGTVYGGVGGGIAARRARSRKESEGKSKKAAADDKGPRTRAKERASDEYYTAATEEKLPTLKNVQRVGDAQIQEESEDMMSMGKHMRSNPMGYRMRRGLAGGATGAIAGRPFGLKGSLIGAGVLGAAGAAMPVDGSHEMATAREMSNLNPATREALVAEQRDQARGENTLARFGGMGAGIAAGGGLGAYGMRAASGIKGWNRGPAGIIGAVGGAALGGLAARGLMGRNRFDAAAQAEKSAEVLFKEAVGLSSVGTVLKGVGKRVVGAGKGGADMAKSMGQGGLAQAGAGLQEAGHALKSNASLVGRTVKSFAKSNPGQAAAIGGGAALTGAAALHGLRSGDEKRAEALFKEAIGIGMLAKGIGGAVKSVAKPAMSAARGAGGGVAGAQMAGKVIKSQLPGAAKSVGRMGKSFIRNNPGQAAMGAGALGLAGGAALS